MRAGKPREIAGRVLLRHQQGQEYVEDLLDQALASTAVSDLDRGLVQELAFGAVRWQATLDWLIARKTKGRAQKAPLQVLLRLGLYQLFWLDRIPDHAAVNETVELARALGCGPQAGFLNAVLRAYLRERDATEQALTALQAQQPALGWSHPEWLCERWRQRWGEAPLRQLLEWNNRPPPTYARLNTLRATAAQIKPLWDQEQVRYAACGWDWTGTDLVFELKDHPALASLRSFQNGLFYIQDPSTLLAVHLLDPQPGEAVLDLCAAPGGKTTFIAQRMQDRGLIVAKERNLHRRHLIRDNCERLGVTCVRLAEADRAPAGDLPPAYDRILLDVPCSNTGVLRRRVDLRWRLRPEDVERLRATQLELLRQAAPQLHPGGTLVYSTCSLEAQENQELVAQFLQQAPDYRLATERELLPWIEGTDGAYVAVLRRAGR